MHDRRKNSAEDQGHDNDGQSPVSDNICEELDAVEDPIFKYLPHVRNTFLKFIWYRVISTFMEGMTSANTLDSQPAPFEEAEPLYGG